MMHVGTYQLGYRYVDLYVNKDERGGSFCLNTGDAVDKRHATMTIGVEDLSIAAAVEVLAHEAFEAAAQELCARFRQTSVYVEGASDAYWFMFNHDQMTEITARVGNFLWQALDDLRAALDLLREEKKLP